MTRGDNPKQNPFHNSVLQDVRAGTVRVKRVELPLQLNQLSASHFGMFFLDLGMVIHHARGCGNAH